MVELDGIDPILAVPVTEFESKTSVFPVVTNLEFELNVSVLLIFAVVFNTAPPEAVFEMSRLVNVTEVPVMDCVNELLWKLIVPVLDWANVPLFV